MPNPKGKEPQSYSSVLKSIQDMGGKKKASALLPAMRSMTKYLHKADHELIDATVHYILFSYFIYYFVSFIILLRSIRIGKDDNKVTNLIHYFCAQLAESCTPEENGVCFLYKSYFTNRLWLKFLNKSWIIAIMLVFYLLLKLIVLY